MRAIVDPEKCIGCALCVQICPQVFRMNDDKAEVHLDPVPAELVNKCAQAADEQCPVSAISIEA
jgi:ferredoxin